MPDDTQTRWSMGLSGTWGTLANISAIGLVSVCFWLWQSQAMRNAEQDREALRQQLHDTQKQVEDGHRETIKIYRDILGLQTKNVSTLSRIEKTTAVIAEKQPDKKEP